MKSFQKTLLALGLILIFLAIWLSLSQQKVNESPPQTITLPKTPIPVQLGSSFSFAVISDIHSDHDNLKKTLGKIKADNMDLVIVAGDLTTVGSWGELKTVKEILDEGGTPYSVIPGNHDLWSTGARTISPFKEIFGADYQSFQKEKVKFILINNADGIKGIDRKQSTWIREQIIDCPKITCLVFAHMPLNHPITAHVMGEDNPVVASQAASLVKELVNYKIKQLFAGHVHFFSSYEMDGLQTDTDGAIYTDGNTIAPRFLKVKITLPETKLEKEEVRLLSP